MGWAGLATAGIGAGISTLGNLMKKKVNAPSYKEISTAEEIQRATAANLGVLGQAEQLAEQVNDSAIIHRSLGGQDRREHSGQP